jgi:hypothetical protein
VDHIKENFFQDKAEEELPQDSPAGRTIFDLHLNVDPDHCIDK